MKLHKVILGKGTIDWIKASKNIDNKKSLDESFDFVNSKGIRVTGDFDKLRVTNTIIEEKARPWSSMLIDKEHSFEKQLPKYFDYLNKYGGDTVIYRVQNTDWTSSAYEKSIEILKETMTHYPNKKVNIEFISDDLERVRTVVFNNE